MGHIINIHVLLATTLQLHTTAQRNNNVTWQQQQDRSESKKQANCQLRRNNNDNDSNDNTTGQSTRNRSTVNYNTMTTTSTTTTTRQVRVQETAWQRWHQSHQQQRQSWQQQQRFAEDAQNSTMGNGDLQKTRNAARCCQLCQCHSILSQPLVSGGSSPLISGRRALALRSASFTNPRLLQSPRQRSAWVVSEDMRLRT